MIRNVLLMLSSNQPPYPTEEFRWHVDRCRSHGTTHLITTQTLKDMVLGKSIVAFYGNASLGSPYFGHGIYMGYTGLYTPRGQQLLKSSSLYDAEGIPENSKGFIHLKDVREALKSEDLVSLNGIIDSTGESGGFPLSLQNIPRGQARTKVYYIMK
jgi:hypothetical protein